MSKDVRGDGHKVFNARRAPIRRRRTRPQIHKPSNHPEAKFKSSRAISESVFCRFVKYGVINIPFYGGEYVLNLFLLFMEIVYLIFSVV